MTSEFSKQEVEQVERMISLSRSCEASFEAVSEVLRRDSTQAIRIAGVGAKVKDSRTTVHVHPHRPWRSTDVEVSPTIGRLETVDSSTVRVNLSWRASGSKHVPGVTGHLEVRRLSSTACEFHYVGTYDPGGIVGQMRERLVGRQLASDVANQLLDKIIANIQAHLAAPL